MPADYVACRDSLIKKGVSEKTAKRRCAIWFYKKHGVSVNEAHEKGEGAFPDEPKLDEEDWSAMELISSELDKIPNQTTSTETTNSTKPDAHGDKEIFDVQAIDMDFLDEFGIVEIVATKVGATAYTSDGRAVTWTEKVLKKAAASWKFGNVSINHNGLTYGKIIDSFFEIDSLKQVVKVGDELKGWLKKFGKNVGVSTEASKVKINKKMDIMDAFGTGVTFVFPPESPACPIEEGCGIMGIEKTEEKKDEVKITIDVDVKNEDETPIDGIVVSKYSNPWTTDINSTVPYETRGLWIPPDYNPNIKITYTTSSIDTPNNINEEIKMADVKTEAVIIKADADKKGDNMVEEQKPADTICAKKHESIVKEKDSEIEALKKEVETLKATVAQFNAEKKTKLLEFMNKEYGLETKAYESKEIPVIEDILATLKAMKDKEAKEPEVNSGAEVKAVEQKTEPKGNVVTATISEAEAKAKTEADAVAELLKLAEATDGIKRT